MGTTPIFFLGAKIIFIEYIQVKKYFVKTIVPIALHIDPSLHGLKL